MKKITILIADDNKKLIEGLLFIFTVHAHLEVIGQVFNGQQAIEHYSNLKPDIVIMDINMEPVNGFDACRIITKNYPEAKIIGFSVKNITAYADIMMQNGAKGFVSKTAPPSELVKAIEKVHEGGNYVGSDII